MVIDPELHVITAVQIPAETLLFSMVSIAIWSCSGSSTMPDSCKGAPGAPAPDPDDSATEKLKNFRNGSTQMFYVAD